MVRTEFTLDDLEQMPDDAMHRELIDGELIELPPPESKHSDAAMNLYDTLGPFVRSNRLGRAYVEAGYKVTADKRNWVQPDVSFVSKEYVASGRKKRFFEGAPDLAVEVISPSERPKDILAKRNVLFQNGCKEIWIIRPKSQTVEIWTTTPKMDRELREADTLSSPLFDGWSMPVASVFAFE
jgi:Uma2 family endonuclease